ncbi:MAG: Cof-type HAD-IIB family hydrolase [Bacteroidetes bacterium]|nr:Cof-type HAD-IIB family hydrolase [Bacteroidota bacterium]
MIGKADLKKIKLVVFDLDGTLLNENNEIGINSISLIKKLQMKGVNFSIATGRLYSAMVHHAETLELKVPLITLDGSMIKTMDNNIIFESCVSKKHIRKAIQLADQNSMNIALCHADAIYYTENNSAIPSITDKFGAAFVEVKSYENYLNNTLEIIITGDYKNSIKAVKEKLSFPYCWGLNSVYYKAHSHDIYNLEIRNQGSSKGKGLKRLIRYLKIKESETAVMGDWYNDRSLFETKAVKAAIQNAVPEIKRMADYITERNNNEDGTAEFLEMILKAKK